MTQTDMMQGTSTAPASPSSTPQGDAELDALLADMAKDPEAVSTLNAAVDEGQAEQENRGFFSKIANGTAHTAERTYSLAYSAAAGLNNGLNEMSDFYHDYVTSPFAVAANKVVTIPGVENGEYKVANRWRLPDSWTKPKSNTVADKVAHSIGQFGIDLLGAGKVLKAAKVTGHAVTKGGRIIEGMAIGALADFVGFDPHEARLSNLIQEFPTLRNPVNEFLAAKPGDTDAEGRFKNALEGLGLGAAIEVLFLGIRGLRSIRRGHVEEAVKDFDQLAGKVPEDPVDLSKDVLSPEELKAANDNASDMSRLTGEEGKEATTVFKDGTPDTAQKVDASGLVNDNAVPVKPRLAVLVDETQLRQHSDFVISEQAFGRGRNISGVRTDLIENGEDMKAILSATRRIYEENIAKVVSGDTDGHQTFAMVRKVADQLADTYGSNTDLILSRMSNRADDATGLAAEVLANRDFLATTSTKLKELAGLVSDPLGPIGGYANRHELRAAFTRAFEVHANALAYHKGIQTNIARSLNAMKLTAREKAQYLTDLDPHSARNFDEEALVKMAGRIALADNDKAVAKLVSGGFAQRLVGSTSEYYINALLSSPKTHLVNTLSGAAMTLYNPFERIVAGALRGSKEEITEGALQYATVVQSVQDALKLSWTALKEDRAILDFRNRTVEQIAPAISARNWNVSNPVYRTLVDGLGTLARLPTRLMTAEDEFFKQLNYRSHVRARALRQAMTEGDLANAPMRVRKALDDSVDDLGRATDKEALEAARSITFSNDLTGKSWTSGRTLGEGMQSMANNHPGLRLITPFIRTPTNLIRWAHNHTPFLNLARHDYNRAFWGHYGPEAQAKARAQFATGSMMAMGVINLTLDGKITGSGPADPEQRRMLEATGWKPYSFVTTNDDGSVTYTSYSRMDPFATVIGIAADSVEIGGHLLDADYEKAAQTVAVAMANQVKDKTYLQGMTGLLNAISQPERNLEAYTKNFTASFIPNALRTLTNDPVVREARSVLDAMKAKVPGFSATLAPKRNVFGEKVVPYPGLGPDWLSPIVQDVRKEAVNPTSKDWYDTPQTNHREEFARLSIKNDKAFRPPPDVVEGVDLTEFPHPNGFTAHDRYQELVGTVTIRGRTLTETLNEVINSPVYRSRLTDGDSDNDGSRIGVLRGTLQNYRDYARLALMKEMPELVDQFRQAKMKKALALTPQ